MKRFVRPLLAALVLTASSVAALSHGGKSHEAADKKDAPNERAGAAPLTPEEDPAPACPDVANMSNTDDGTPC